MSKNSAEPSSGTFPTSRSLKLTSGVDLEKSFGPIYARGLLRQGRTAFALLGVNAQETQSSIDAALTFGILWLDVCRQAQGANVLVEGLKMFVPVGCSALVRERMANLNRDAAKWALYELDERHDALVEIDCADRGNVATRLVHVADEQAARERFGVDSASSADSAELRSCGAVGGGDCFPLARVGVCAGAAGMHSRIISQHRGNCVWGGRGGADS